MKARLDSSIQQRSAELAKTASRLDVPKNAENVGRKQRDDPHRADAFEKGLREVARQDVHEFRSDRNSGKRGPRGAERRGQNAPLSKDAPTELARICSQYGLRRTYPPAVMEQVQQILANPGIDDPKLTDLTNLAFITIDNDDSKDLDQAMFIRRDGKGGYELFYALSDPSYYLKPGTPLFEEALKRAVTFYLPDGSVPMLPPQLSEGVISLNEKVDRRAVVYKFSLDKNGEVTGHELMRAKVHSREQLTYHGVQEYHDKPEGSPLAGHDYTETLDLLEELGKLRMARAQRQDVVQFVRGESGVRFADETHQRLTVVDEKRVETERWNEQISLLTNSVGAAGLFKIHPAPTREKLEAFRDLVANLVGALDLPELWRWQKNESLADYIERLPKDGESRRLFQAIQLSAIRTNQRAEFSRTPGLHSGIGANPYSRITAPMREMIGVVTHALILDGPNAIPSKVVDQVVANANEAAKKERDIDRDVQKIAIDHVLQTDLEKKESERPRYTGTVMELSPSKVVVQLDEPPMELKIYVADLPGRWVLGKGAAELRDETGQSAPIRIGGAMSLQVKDYDEERGRWVVAP